MTPDGTLSSPCSLCCKRTDRLPGILAVAFSCSLPAPPPRHHPPPPALSSHVWLLLTLGLVLRVPVSERPSHQPRAASVVTLHSSPLFSTFISCLSLSVSHLIVRTCPSGGTSSVWFMAVDHGVGPEQALSKQVRGSRGCLVGK